MKKATLRLSSFLVALAVLLSAVPMFMAVSADAVSVKYEFIGDNAEKAGFAQSIITISSSSAKTGYYLIYYTDGTNLLSGYDHLASVAISGTAVSVEIPDGTMIPQGAKGIAVFESDTHFKDNPPAMSTAVATAAIPASKQLSLGNAEVVFGAASDVHVNYEYYDNGTRQAYEKWSNTLKLFSEKGASYVIVTGDMTGDENMSDEPTLDKQYEDYIDLINKSNIKVENVYESVGNHGNTPTGIGVFSQYTMGSDEVHPYTNSPYYYVVKKGATGKKDNVFVFLWQEITASGQSSKVDNFSAAQVDWLATVLNQFDNDKNNVFVIAHSPFLNYGAGDRYKGGGYSNLTTFKSDYTQNMRLKGLLQEHKDVIVMSGHTHLTLYDGSNYSDVNNEFARTVHMSSTCWPRAYTADGSSCPAGTDGRYSAKQGNGYGSEAYIVSVYEDYIVYTGYNVSTGNIIPAGCLIMPTSSNKSEPVGYPFKGSGSESDPYLIEDAQDFMLLTSGFNANTETDVTKMYGYGKYFLQTKDIDLSNVKAYVGTYAATMNQYTGAQYKSAFAGTYNGNGKTLLVNIDGPDQRSVFPYVYGMIVNTVIKGKIVGSDDAQGSAQPIRSLREGASLINCYFDLQLSANRVNGVVYSNYGYMYNVYSTGTQTAIGNKYPVANSSGEGVNNVFHYCLDSSANVIDGTVGVQTSNIDEVIAAFGDRTSEAYKTAKSKLGSLELCNVISANNNLALGKSFTPHGYYTTQGEWPADYRGNLTDGKISDKVTYDNAWYGFNRNTSDDGVCNVQNGIGTVVVDLQDNYSITSVKAHLFVGSESGITAPSFVRASASFDGISYTSPVDISVPSSGVNNIAWATGNLALDGRYVKLEFGVAGAYVFVDEIQVYGGVYEGDPNPPVDSSSEEPSSDPSESSTPSEDPSESSTPSEDPSESSTPSEDPSESSTPSEDPSESSTTSEDPSESSTPSEDPSEPETPKDPVDPDPEPPVDPEVMKGDINGNKEIDSMDYVLLKRAYFGTYKLKEASVGDINGNKEIDSMDYVFLKRAYFGTYKIK